jgi:hypothetical protein
MAHQQMVPPAGRAGQEIVAFHRLRAVALYDEVFESLHKIEQDTDTPPTRAEVLRIAHIKALMMIGQSIRETTFSDNPVYTPSGHADLELNRVARVQLSGFPTSLRQLLGLLGEGRD